MNNTYSIISPTTANLFSVSPDHLGVVAGVIVEPELEGLSEIVKTKDNSYTNGLTCALLNPGDSTSRYQARVASSSTSVINFKVKFYSIVLKILNLQLPCPFCCYFP